VQILDLTVDITIYSAFTILFSKMFCASAEIGVLAAPYDPKVAGEGGGGSGVGRPEIRLPVLARDRLCACQMQFSANSAQHDVTDKRGHVLTGLRQHDTLCQHLLDPSQGLPRAFFVLNQREPHVPIAVIAKTDAR
jgi:hypothetical protein